MQEINGIKVYSPLEENINIFSHAVGFILSVLATIFLFQKSLLSADILSLVSALVFGFGLMTLYAASTFYHSARDPLLRKKLRIVDHASIYCLIAGTYTPFSLLVLKGSTGWMIFSIAWLMALVGIVLKIFFTGRYQLISTLMYVFMGWIIIVVFEPLKESLPAAGLNWLIAGGLCYTVGAVLYAIKKIKLNHAIFHLFVLAGSFCHFMAVYFYVMPAA
jgi:hemolysin III